MGRAGFRQSDGRSNNAIPETLRKFRRTDFRNSFNADSNFNAENLVFKPEHIRLRLIRRFRLVVGLLHDKSRAYN